MAASTPTTFGDDCILMMHCDDFTDSSDLNLLIVNSNADLNPTTKKFGTNAIDCTAAGLDVVYARSDGLGSMVMPAEFTIDYWVYMKVLPGDFTAFHSNDALPPNFGLGGHTAVGNTYLYVNGASATRTGFAYTASSWIHCCMTRDSSNDVRVFINGNSLGTAYANAGTCAMELGAVIGINTNFATYHDFIYDEIRLVKGTAVWTSNFTPPTAAYIGGGAPPGPEYVGISAMPLMGVGHGG